MQYIGRFEEAVVTEARNWEVDGVVCGHIHHAELRTIDGTLYANTGDWVESCTALVEHIDGRLEIVCWPRPATPDRFRGATVYRMKCLPSCSMTHRARS